MNTIHFTVKLIRLKYKTEFESGVIFMVMVQALTPQQSKALWTFLWEAADKLIWLGLGYLGVRIHQAIKKIRPGIVADVAVIVVGQTKAALEAHAAEDKKNFASTEDLVRSEANETRREIHAAIQEHVAQMHLKTAHHRGD